jgi:hypothetical protein
MDFEEISRAIFMIYDVKLERCFFMSISVYGRIY